MTAALRLVVAWMLGVVAALCVVALAAWRGQLWFHDTRVACPAALPAPAKEMLSFAAPADASRDAIVKYLRSRFDEIEYLNDGAVVMGLAYDGAPLLEVRNDRLQRALPGTRFFTTKLATAEIEFPGVETILVSFRHGSKRDDIRASPSPASGRPTHKFFRQFLGISAPTLRDREEIAFALAELLAAATYEGAARPLPSREGRARAELRHNGMHWRDIEITSNRLGRVNQIIVRNPRDPRDLHVVSDFSVFLDP